MYKYSNGIVANNDTEDSFDEDNFCWDVKVDGSVLLSTKSLGALPNRVLTLQNVTKLDLSYNYLETLPDDLCNNLRSLKSLLLSGNSLQSIPDNIDLLTSLEEMTLGENRLHELPSSVGRLINLRSLVLNANRIESLPEEICNLAALEKLMLDENRLYNLPKNFGRLRNLQWLECPFNNLSELPEDFGSLTSLTKLNLSSNKKLAFLPPSFAELPNLEILDLSETSLKALPDQLKSSSKLQILMLDANELSLLPPWANNMPEIRQFSLKSNYVQGEPFTEEFGLVSTKIVHFDISGNMLSGLPESFAEITTLEYIDIGSALFEPERKRNLRNGNNILQLPKEFGVHLSNLRELRIDECAVEVLPTNFGRGLPNLVIFDSHCNNLVELPESFCLMAKLEMCTISMNGLQRLPERLGDLIALKELRLENNQVGLRVPFLSRPKPSLTYMIIITFSCYSKTSSRCFPYRSAR